MSKGGREIKNEEGMKVRRKKEKVMEIFVLLVY